MPPAKTLAYFNQLNDFGRVGLEDCRKLEFSFGKLAIALVDIHLHYCEFRMT